METNQCENNNHYEHHKGVKREIYIYSSNLRLTYNLQICISSQAKDILTSCPEDRTLVQVESVSTSLYTATDNLDTETACGYQPRTLQTYTVWSHTATYIDTPTPCGYTATYIVDTYRHRLYTVTVWTHRATHTIETVWTNSIGTQSQTVRTQCGQTA